MTSAGCQVIVFLSLWCKISLDLPHGSERDWWRLKGEGMNRYIAIGGAALALVLGVFVYVSDPISYMGNDATTCANCHVMDSAYEDWYHGPHGRAVLCSECHAPHGNVVVYYYAKTKLGMRDVYAFSTGQIPEPIRATKETKATVQENCIRCHATTVEGIMAGAQPYDRNCWDCHRATAHGERGLSLLPRQEK
jgi:cytochrome c nitrite reductase small subunit